MTPALPIRLLDCAYDEESQFIVASVLFLESKVRRRFCWPAADLIEAFGIRGTVEPHHWKKFCQDMKGKEIKMSVEMVGDPEQPAATFAQMSEIQQNVANKYSNLFLSEE